jgi:putative FmdB family regulatory protein
MPSYDYRCKKCHAKMEIFQSIKDEPLVLCPDCGRKTLVRGIGTGTAAFVKDTKNPCSGSLKNATDNSSN